MGRFHQRTVDVQAPLEKGAGPEQVQPLFSETGTVPGLQVPQYLIEQPYGSEVALLTGLPAIASSSAAVT